MTNSTKQANAIAARPTTAIQAHGHRRPATRRAKVVRGVVAFAFGSIALLQAIPARTDLQNASKVSEREVRQDLEARPLPPGMFGESGGLRAVFGTADALARRLELQPFLSGLSIEASGVHPLTDPGPDGDPLVVVTLEPFASSPGTTLERYRVGRWPTRGAAALDPRYAPPADFIAVTQGNEATLISKRFRLRDFLTHDQPDVWPKVLVLRVALLDKLELIGDELERRGLPSSLRIMSGFRTPQYNALGVGDRGGRATNSRHMYGDAADVFVDGNEDGVMDDLDGDGRVTVADARMLLAVAESVEGLHPNLVGGLSAYPANAGHGPFVHVDARGSRARW